MKIVLVNLPWQKGGRWGVRAGSRWPHIKTIQEKDYLPFPFFLAYAAALLRKEGFAVSLIDALAQELPTSRFLHTVLSEKPDLVVAETSTPSLFNDLDILSRFPKDLPVALCGPEANIHNLEFLGQYKFINYVFKGEYELTLLELARRLEARKSVSDVAGLAFRENDNWQMNPPRPLIEDLDMLPWPLRDGVPMEKYNDTPGGIPTPSVQMWSSRGCPYQCAFCLWPQLLYQKSRYRIRNTVNVVDEMEYLVKKRGFRSVYFDDDTTNIGKLRMLRLAEEIKRRGVKVPWAMMARADLMDEDILESLRSAGLYAVKYGVESAEQGLLDPIGKNMDLRRAERMIRFSKSIGIKVHLTFSFGLPGETQDSIRRTMEYAKELDPDSAQFSIATAFPGTSYYQELEQRGHIVSRSFADYDGNFKSMLRTDSLSGEDLEKAKRDADRMWEEHIWQTRSGPVLSGDNWRKLITTIKKFGLYFGLSKAFLFMDSKFKSFCARMKLSPERVRQSWLDCQSQWRTWARKARKHYLNVLGVYTQSCAFKGPDCVQIDLTSKCNNNCVSCWCNSPLLGDRIYQGARRYKTLPAHLVKGLIDELGVLGTEELFFSGGGEPFMHPEIMSIVEHAKSRGLSCCINTNFTLVNEVAVRRIVELGVDSMTVSVWAGTPQTYALTHPNKDEATFHRIKCMLKMLNTIKKDGKPYIKVYNVISNLNYAELEKMLEFAEETGSEAMEFAVVDTIPGATDKLMLSQKERAEVLSQCEKIRKRGSRVHISNLEHFVRRLSDPGAHKAEYDTGLLSGAPCYVGWVFSRVMSNGDVNFCLKAHRVPVGSLYRNSFHEIWNSKEQKVFRQKALEHDINDPFFKKLGNDENCQVGCYKSCDNLGHNDQIASVLAGLNPVQKLMLSAAALVAKHYRRS